MEWHVEYYNAQLQETILAFPSGILARYLRLTDLMMAHGPNLGMPHTRALGEGLFELRMNTIASAIPQLAAWVSERVSNDLSSLATRLLSVEESPQLAAWESSKGLKASVGCSSVCWSVVAS